MAFCARCTIRGSVVQNQWSSQRPATTRINSLIILGLELFGSIHIAVFSTASQQAWQTPCYFERGGTTLGHGWGEKNLFLTSSSPGLQVAYMSIIYRKMRESSLRIAPPLFYVWINHLHWCGVCTWDTFPLFYIAALLHDREKAQAGAILTDGCDTAHCKFHSPPLGKHQTIK